jgi:hypothetical protein
MATLADLKKKLGIALKATVKDVGGSLSNTARGFSNFGSAMNEVPAATIYGTRAIASQIPKIPKAYSDTAKLVTSPIGKKYIAENIGLPNVRKNLKNFISGNRNLYEEVGQISDSTNKIKDINTRRSLNLVLGQARTGAMALTGARDIVKGTHQMGKYAPGGRDADVGKFTGGLGTTALGGLQVAGAKFRFSPFGQATTLGENIMFEALKNVREGKKPSIDFSGSAKDYFVSDAFNIKDPTTALVLNVGVNLILGKGEDKVVKVLKDPAIMKSISRLIEVGDITGAKDFATRVLADQGGFAKPGEFIPKKQPTNKLSNTPYGATKGTSKIDDLTQEARKYKSADEFVKSKVDSFHGTDAVFDEFDITKASGDQYGKGINSVTDPKRASMYGKNVVGVYTGIKNPIDLNKKVAPELAAVLKKETGVDFSSFDNKTMLDRLYGKGLSADTIVGLFKKAGYDGTVKKLPDGHRILVAFDTSSIKTKAQLTDIWNKAQGVSEMNKPPKAKPPLGGIVKKEPPFLKEDIHSVKTGEALSELGADTPKEKFADWVNTRRSSTVSGIVKGKEFEALDKKGMKAVFEFQAGKTTKAYTKLRKYFDNRYKELDDAGVDFNYKKDYLTQLWKEPQEEVEKVFKSLGTKPGFTLESTFKNYQEGMAAGLTPKYTKISEIVGAYESATNKALADRRFFDYLMDDGMVLRANRAPKDWITLDPDRFPKFKVKTGEGAYVGSYKAPPEIAKMINNYLGDANFEWLERVANWTSATKNRVLSFGIPGTAINMHGFNILARNVMASKNPIEGGITGIKYMINPKSAAKALDAQMANAPAAVKNGLTLSTNEYKSILEEPAGFRDKFGTVWNDLFEKGLFDRMLPALKLQKYQEVYEGYVKSGMPKEEAGRAAASFTNDVFGGMNWEALGKSRDMQNLLRATILAPDWLQTNIRLSKKLPESVLRFKDPNLAAYRQFLATFLGTYVTMNVVNKLSSGHYMFQNDPGNAFNLEAGFTEDGQKRYVRPFATAADFIRIPVEVGAALRNGDIQRVGRIVRNRLSIPLGVGVGVLTDTDYTGQPIGYSGKDKWGNQMPIGQRIYGVGGETATLAGMPAFVKQGLDYVSGRSGAEQSLLQGFELPFRYSGGTKSTLQKQAQDIETLKGKALYDRNESLRGQTKLSENQLESVKMGDTDIPGIIKNRQENATKEIIKKQVLETGKEIKVDGVLFYPVKQSNGKIVVRTLSEQKPTQSAKSTQSGKSGKYVVTNETTGIKTIIDLSTPVQEPKLTGLDDVDKKLISSYKGKLTSRANAIEKVYLSGQLSADEANKALEEIKLKKEELTQKSGVKVKKKGIKVSFSKIKPIKIKSTRRKAVRITKGGKIPKPNLKRIAVSAKALPKVKLSVPKTKVGKIRNTISGNLTKLA